MGRRFYIAWKSTNTWYQLSRKVKISYKQQQLAEMFGSICFKNYGNGCGKLLPLYMLTVDHIFPISMGGPVNDICNMQLLCSACHKKKTLKDRKCYV
jgi:5-methylcytosine-specific restriction endonuclease McrA